MRTSTILLALLALTGAFALDCTATEFALESCVACDESCLTCSDDTTTACLTCYPGTVLSATNTCDPCPADSEDVNCACAVSLNCNTCDTESQTCVDCPTDYTLNSDYACVVCDGYYDSTDASCTACTDDYCTACSTTDADTCDECDLHYGTDIGDCTLCST